MTVRIRTWLLTGLDEIAHKLRLPGRFVLCGALDRHLLRYDGWEQDGPDVDLDVEDVRLADGTRLTPEIVEQIVKEATSC